MTLAPPASTPNPAPRSAPLRWAVSDIAALTRRDLLHWMNQPAPVVLGWLFPVMVVLMFGTLFGGAIETPGGSYYEYLMPGMFAMTMLFGLETTMTAVATDAAKGVTDRFRSMDMTSGAVVVARCVADLLNTLVALAIMVGVGLAAGWRWHAGIGSAVAAIAVLLLLRVAMLWFGIYLGLIVKGPESVAAVQILVWPVLFLSNAFVDPGSMPGWLAAIADWNPLSSTTNAVRDLFGNPGWNRDGWTVEHAGWLAVFWPAAITAVFLPLSIRKYRDLAN
jgi:ABC-2 type transport system permease protein